MPLITETSMPFLYYLLEEKIFENKTYLSNMFHTTDSHSECFCFLFELDGHPFSSIQVHMRCGRMPEESPPSRKRREGFLNIHNS